MLKAHDAREMGRYWSGLAGSPRFNTRTTVLIFHAAGTVFQCWLPVPRDSKRIGGGPASDGPVNPVIDSL